MTFSYFKLRTFTSKVVVKTETRNVFGCNKLFPLTAKHNISTEKASL